MQGVSMRFSTRLRRPELSFILALSLGALAAAASIGRAQDAPETQNAVTPEAAATAAYVRINQAGYETGQTARAYLMSTIAETGATFKVVNSKGKTKFSGAIGALNGTWAYTASYTYKVYVLDFKVPGGDTYTLSVAGPAAATSPKFAVNEPSVLYPGLLLNTLFFYETSRDGPNYIQNALRSAPGHVNDTTATLYDTPLLDDDANIDIAPPNGPLVSAGLPTIDASGGWWDAGDYMKYVADISYVTELMEIGVRDFPSEMGAKAATNPPAPPVSVSWAGNSGIGAPTSTDFTAEAAFGVDFLQRMWNSTTKTLAYQVDNSQEWDYYGYGNPTSNQANCGGTYASSYCLFTEYDIWTLPQAADDYLQPGDPEACDPYTSFYICHRPVFVALPAGSKVSPNIAGRLAASFALCYQINKTTNPTQATTCLQNAEQIYALANTSIPDPANWAQNGCAKCLLTSTPPSGETVWEDDMELGATELYFALEGGNLPAGLPVTDPLAYLKDAAKYARGYVHNVYNKNMGDTLNLLDVSGLAHFELYRAIVKAGNPAGLSVSESWIRGQFLHQVKVAIEQAETDAWDFGEAWENGDVTSHGTGLSVMASEAYWVTHTPYYKAYAQRWLGNILGANSWGSSFIVGDGITFPDME